jgi:nucleoside-diphosphate-sugar epimerase
MQAAILEGVSRAGARMIVAENLYMYGQVTGKIHEGLPYRAHTRKGKARASMAEAILEAHAGGQVKAAIGRGSDFFGPEVLTSTLGERVFYPALQGKTAQFVGGLDVSHTYTFIDDFGSALVLLGERDGALGQVWHVPNNRPDVTQREIAQLIFEEIRTSPKMSGMGRMMMRIGGLFVAGARETVEMMYEFENPFVVDSTKFEQAFGVKATPLREAIHRTVEWYRGHTKTSS